MTVRERLTEWAVSTLPDRERAEVEQHLQWCAGCRKEASELRGGAALVGLSLSQSEPPPGLEGRVVTIVQRASAKAAPGRRSRRIFRGSVLVAAAIGVLALAGSLVARTESNLHKAHQSELQAKAFAARLAGLVQQFQSPGQPHDISRAILGPVGGGTGGGGAIRVVSPRFEDLAVVIVGALPRRDAPYRVWLLTPSGRRLWMGLLRVDTGGGGTIAHEFSADLRLYRYVQVLNSKGHMVLSGSFAQS
jgi:hypothetical protein